MLQINGVTISTPSDLQVAVMDLSKAERNAEGDLIIERICTKQKLEMSWKYLSQTDCATLLTAVSGVTFTVTYPDPTTGANRTGTFYVGDRSMPVLDYQNNVIRWKDIKFNLIEV
jgi:hypothetical protein